MLEFLATPEAQLVIWTAILASLLVLGIYVIGKFRPGEEKDRFGTSDLITNFRELHALGQLTDDEFRTIKTKLAGRLQEEVPSHDEAQRGTDAAARNDESSAERQGSPRCEA
jgi:hypothetical protein